MQSKTDDCFAICCIEPCEVLGQIALLAPPGPAHEIWPGSNKEKWWQIYADIYAEAIAADCKLMDEAFPCTATDLLPDWERFLDVSCFKPADDIELRRKRLCAILAGFNLVNCSDYVYLAALFGFTVCCNENVCTFKGVPGLQSELNCFDGVCPDIDLPAPAPTIYYAYPDIDAPDCRPISCNTVQVYGAHSITITIDPTCSPALFPDGCEESSPDQDGADCTKPDCAISFDDLVCIFKRLKPAHLHIRYVVADCILGECPPLPELPPAVVSKPC